MPSSKDIKFVSAGSFHQGNGFLAGDGNEIEVGDTVEWTKPGDIFPTFGVVQNYGTWQIACWNQILDRFEYYSVVSEKNKKGEHNEKNYT